MSELEELENNDEEKKESKKKTKKGKKNKEKKENLKNKTNIKFNDDKLILTNEIKFEFEKSNNNKISNLKLTNTSSIISEINSKMDILSNELNSQISLRKIEKENNENNEIRDLIYKLNEYSEIPQNKILNNIKSSKEYKEEGVQSEQNINNKNMNKYLFKEKSIPINNNSFNYFNRRSKSINYNDEQIKMNINQNYYNNQNKDSLNNLPYKTQNTNKIFDYKNNYFNTHMNSNNYSNNISNNNYNNNLYRKHQYSLINNLNDREIFEYKPKNLKQNLNSFNKNKMSARLRKMDELYNINKNRKYPKIYRQQPYFNPHNNQNRQSKSSRNDLMRTNKLYSNNFLFQNNNRQKNYNIESAMETLLNENNY